jgi:hypothetical protein
MDTKPSKENGLDKPSSHSASEIVRRSRLRRTFLFAGLFALVAMVFVPSPRSGYRLIFDTSDTSIAFFQLLLNVAFAAVAGAIVANLSRRAVLWTAGMVAIMVLVVGGWFGFSVFHRQMVTRAEGEEQVADSKIKNGDFEAAKEHLLNASKYWWWCGWWNGARYARELAFDQEKMKKRAAVYLAQKNEERARQLEARASELLGKPRSPFDVFDSDTYLASKNITDEKRKEAKQLLLDAAESWHNAGNTAEEQRVRAWEAKVPAVDPEKRRLAQKKEFDRQWVISAQKVIDAHPELRNPDDFERLMKILEDNPVFSQRLDGFEYAYKVMTKQVPRPPAEQWPPPEHFGGIFHDIVAHDERDILHERIRKVLAFLNPTATPTAAKPSSIPHNHE